MSENVAPVSALKGSISLSNISKNFGVVQALKDVTLEVEPGTILGIIGPNGAGKSTLVRIIAGVMKPTTGEVVVAGYNVNKDRNKVKKVTGILPESAGLYEKLSIREFLQLIGGLYNIERSKIEEKLDYYSKYLDLGGLEDRLIETLSKGQKQKVAFIASLVNEPLILLLDEPTIALDPKAQRRLLEIILTYQREDRVIIITSHLLESLEKYCNRFAVLLDGKFTFTGNPAEFIASVNAKNVEEAYLLHVEEHETRKKND